ncbi:MAG: hypothetical protein NTY38_05095 [Acidobacteria bacterium]|nr:hypothetical protein [Acidobacteriota bacterium]
MQIPDFSRSFLLFRVDTLKKPPVTVTHKPPFTANNARVRIDCTCRIVDRESRQAYSFVLGASCKTERVNVASGIWTEPNADFIPIAGDTHFLMVKTFDHTGRRILLHPPELGEQPHRHIVENAAAFDDLRITLHRVDAKLLETPDEVIEATFANQPLVATTDLVSERYEARLEYPVKTINAGEREHFFQTDTGPVLLPDLSASPVALLNGMELAFAAFNHPEWTEFLVRDLSPVGEGISVYHYCRSVRMDAVNRIWRPFPSS